MFCVFGEVSVTNEFRVSVFRVFGASMVLSVCCVCSVLCVLCVWCMYQWWVYMEFSVTSVSTVFSVAAVAVQTVLVAAGCVVAEGYCLDEDHKEC